MMLRQKNAAAGEIAARAGRHAPLCETALERGFSRFMRMTTAALIAGIVALGAARVARADFFDGLDIPRKMQAAAKAEATMDGVGEKFTLKFSTRKYGGRAGLFIAPNATFSYGRATSAGMVFAVPVNFSEGKQGFFPMLIVSRDLEANKTRYTGGVAYTDIIRNNVQANFAAYANSGVFSTESTFGKTIYGPKYSPWSVIAGHTLFSDNLKFTNALDMLFVHQKISNKAENITLIRLTVPLNQLGISAEIRYNLGRK
jgi:hypothetical protein